MSEAHWEPFCFPVRIQTKIDEENQTQESLLERMMETELELEEMEASESAFVRRQERY